jgi:hypothetical protein
MMAVYSVVRTTRVAAPPVAVHRATSAVAMVSVLWGIFVVKHKLAAHPAPHVVALQPDVVRRRTLSVVMEVVVPATAFVVKVEAVVTPIHLFVAPTVSPAGKQLQTAASGRGGSIR